MPRNVSPSITVGGVTFASPIWRGVGIVGFLAAGIMFVAATVVSFAVPEPLPLLDAHMAIAIAFLLVGVVGFYAVQKPDLDRIGRWGTPVLVVGLLLVAVGVGATHVDLPLSPAAAVGLPMAWVGGLLVGATTYRRGSLPRWSGIALAVGFPGAALVGAVVPEVPGASLTSSGTYTGAALPGLCWFGVAYALWRSAPET